MGKTHEEAILTDRDTGSQGLSGRRKVVAGGLVLLLACLYAPVLLRLLRLAASEDLYSHLPLIPFVCGYLLFIARGRDTGAWRSSWRVGGVLGGAGVATLIFSRFVISGGEGLPANDLLFWPMLSWVLLIYGVVAVCGGWGLMRAYWFELLFLVFIIPMPSPVVHVCSVFLQYATADALDVLLGLTGTTFFREGQVFQLPGLTLEVALECSGIRSTLVLVITALLAGHLFFRRRWKKIVLILMAVPLGILRNAFRITCLGLLTIHVDERVIDGPIHHRGGPLFFVFSLVVLFALVFLLRRIGRDKSKKKPEDAANAGT